jgi:16S rRNA U1498 N3-methylase RsmE
VDQVIFVQQAGRNKHEHIVDSLRLFAAEVMPFMKQDQQERDRRKQQELAPYVEAALKRKQWMQPLAPEQIPVVQAYGKSVVAAKDATDKPTYRIGTAGGFEVPMEDLVEKKLNAAE